MITMKAETFCDNDGGGAGGDGDGGGCGGSDNDQVKDENNADDDI